MNKLSLENIVAKFYDPIVCNCFQVKASTIKMAFKTDENQTLDELLEITNAGNGCRACVCRVDRIMRGLPVECGPCSKCPSCGLISKLCNCKCA